MRGGFQQALAAHEPVLFYGGPFSNFAYSPFVAFDRWGREHVYPTVEHYFQAWKAMTIADHDWVLAAEQAGEAKQRGRAIKCVREWEEIKVGVMLTGLRKKFRIRWLQEKLLATGVRVIHEDSPTDFTWGWRNNGQDLLGKLLMQVREEIKAER